MAADLGLIAHAAQGHAHEFPVGGARHALAQGGFADSGRTDQAQDGTAQVLDPLLHGQVLDDALLDLLQAVVIGLEHLFGGGDVKVHLAALFPRRLHQPVDEIAHHGRFRRHRRHELELRELGVRLLARLLRHARRLDALLELADLVRRLIELAELLLNGLHLLIQIVLALALLHLLLHAAANALFDLQHVHLALDHGEHVLEALAHVGDLQNLLLLGELERHVRGDRIGEPPGLFDARERGEDLRRHLLVEFYILLELRDHRAREHVHLALLVALLVRHRGHFGGKELPLGQLLDAGPIHALDQHLDGAVRQLQELQDGRNGAHPVQILALRIVDVGLFLRDQEDALVRLHGKIERDDRFFPADEQRDHHVRIDHDVAQRQHRHGGIGGYYSRNNGFVAH